MTGFRYIIESATDRLGNPIEKREGLFYVKFAQVGKGAILLKDDLNSGIRTSPVEEIKIWDNGVVITTVNSVYYLKLVKTGGI